MIIEEATSATLLSMFGDLTLKEQYDLALWGDLLIPVTTSLLTFSIFAFVRRTEIGVVLGVLIAWIISYFYRVEVASELGMAYYDSLNPYSDYDGVGDNVAVLAFGWLLPLITILVALSIRAVWYYFKRSCHACGNQRTV